MSTLEATCLQVYTAPRCTHRYTLHRGSSPVRAGLSCQHILNLKLELNELTGDNTNYCTSIKVKELTWKKPLRNIPEVKSTSLQLGIRILVLPTTGVGFVSNLLSKIVDYDPSRLDHKPGLRVPYKTLSQRIISN